MKNEWLVNVLKSIEASEFTGNVTFNFSKGDCHNFDYREHVEKGVYIKVPKDKIESIGNTHFVKFR